MHPLQTRRYMQGEFGDRLRHVSYFLSAADRQAYWDGQCDLVPNHFSEMPALLRRTTRCSLVLAAASPPDRHGYFSLGTNADYVSSMIGRVPFYLEVNDQMPHTMGGNVVHVSDVAGWCHVDRPLIEVAPAVPGDARPRDRRVHRRARPERRDAAGRDRRDPQRGPARRSPTTTTSACTPSC